MIGFNTFTAVGAVVLGRVLIFLTSRRTISSGRLKYFELENISLSKSMYNLKKSAKKGTSGAQISTLTLLGNNVSIVLSTTYQGIYIEK